MNGPAHEQTGPLSWATLRYIHHRGLVPYPDEAQDEPTARQTTEGQDHE